MNWNKQLILLREEFNRLKGYSPPGNTDPQRVAIAWARAGIAHRKARLRFTSILVGREITSFKDLSPDELATLDVMVDSLSVKDLLICFLMAKEQWVAMGEIKVRPRRVF